jgi:hypothetical protein
LVCGRNFIEANAKSVKRNAWHCEAGSTVLARDLKKCAGGFYKKKQKNQLWLTTLEREKKIKKIKKIKNSELF